MNVTGGATDVTTYFVLRLAATGVEATGLTITNFDLQYTRSGVAPTAKVDATALAATDSAHGDNQAIEIDATDQPGLYRVDWPDAAFAAGVREVILTVKCATCFTEHLRVQIDTPVNATKLNGIALTGRDIGASVLLSSGTGTGQLSLSSGLVTLAGVTHTGAVIPTVSTLTGHTPQTGDSFARLGAPAGVSISADIAAIEAQTDDIGTAGAGLTAVPWNAAWDAEVQSEVADALAVYDPPTKAELDSAVAPLALEATLSGVRSLLSVASGTADSGTTTTMVDAARTEADTDYWKGNFILFTSGNLAGQMRLITGFTPASDTITFAPATTQTVGTHTYEIIPFARVDVQLWLGSVVNALVSGRVDASTGAMAADVLTAAALAADAVAEIQSGLATAAALDTVDNFLDTEIAAIISTLGTPAGASISADIAAIEAQTDDIGVAGAGLSAIPWNAAWDAEVQSEVADALAVYDPPTRAELTSDIDSVLSALTVIDDFLDTEVAAILADTNELQTDWANGGRLDLLIDAIKARTDVIAVPTRTGTAQAGAAGTITLDASASVVDDFYNNQIIVITGGTGVGQARIVSDYTGSSKVASVNGNWATAPDNTSTFALLGFGAIPGATAPTAAEVRIEMDANSTKLASIEADTQDLQSRVPAALVSGRMDASVGAMAANTLTAAAVASDAVTEIQSGLSTLDAAGIRTAVGLASANLDTQLTAIDDFLDTEVAAIKAKTDNLPASPANESTLTTIAGYIDTEIAAIKAKTDNLPASPAAVGSAMTLTSGERDSVAAAALDLANGVETGVTLRQAQRIQLSSAAGKLSGAATTTISVRDTGDSKNRIVATVDESGNRTAVTLDAS